MEVVPLGTPLSFPPTNMGKKLEDITMLITLLSLKVALFLLGLFMLQADVLAE